MLATHMGAGQAQLLAQNVEPAYTQGFYNRQGASVSYFPMFGGTVGFNHQFSKTLMVGASLGVDYSLNSVSEAQLTSARTFYNKINVIGGYYF